MKMNNYRLGCWPVFAAGLLLSPLQAQTPAGPHGAPPPPPPHREAPAEAHPDRAASDRIQNAVREMVELHQAGKHEEAQKIAQRLREAAKNHPEVAPQIYQAMQAARQHAAQPAPGAPQRPAARQDGPPPRPQPQVVRPNAPQPQPQPPVVRPNVQRQQQMQAARPNAPRQQPQPPVVRPNVQRQQQRAQAQAAPAAPCPWCPMQQQAAQGGGTPGQKMLFWQGTFERPLRAPMLQPDMPQRPQMQMARRGAALQFQGQPARPNMLYRQPMARGEGQPQGPQFRYCPLGAQQRQQAKPGAPQRPLARLGAMLQGPVAKIRHLKVAAMHLAAAGYEQYATKARQEAGRLEKAMKEQRGAPGREQMRDRNPRQDRREQPKPDAKPDAKREKAKPEAKEQARELKMPAPAARPDMPANHDRMVEGLEKVMKQQQEINAKLQNLGNMREQMEVLNNRLRRLEQMDRGDRQPRGDQPRGDQPRGDQPRGDQPRGDQPR